MKKWELCSGTKAISPKSVIDKKWESTDHIPSFSLNCIINPFPIAATFWSTFVWIAFGARIEATQAVLLQAVTQIYVITKQPAMFVILLHNSATAKKKWLLDTAFFFFFFFPRTAFMCNKKPLWKILMHLFIPFINVNIM